MAPAPYGDRLAIHPFGEDGVQDGWICDGTNHQTRTGAFWFGLMGFCGCGRSEDVVGLLREALDGPPRDYKPDTPAPLRFEELSKRIAADPDSAAYLVMYALDAWQLTEHGSSIGGGWLTERGLQAIDAFKGDNDDPDGDL